MEVTFELVIHVKSSDLRQIRRFLSDLGRDDYAEATNPYDEPSTDRLVSVSLYDEDKYALETVEVAVLENFEFKTEIREYSSLLWQQAWESEYKGFDTSFFSICAVDDDLPTSHEETQENVPLKTQLSHNDLGYEEQRRKQISSDKNISSQKKQSDNRLENENQDVGQENPHKNKQKTKQKPQQKARSQYLERSRNNNIKLQPSGSNPSDTKTLITDDITPDYLASDHLDDHRMGDDSGVFKAGEKKFYEEFSGDLPLDKTSAPREIFKEKNRDNFSVPMLTASRTLGKIMIRSGKAFGAGDHATTKATLLLLEKTLGPLRSSKESFLDVGCGTGIFAIWAHKFGFKDIIATDIDEEAIDASHYNRRLNQAKFDLYQDPIPPPGKYQVIVANILPPALNMLFEVFKDRLAESGILFLAGFNESNIEDVKPDWFKAGFKEFDQLNERGWIAVALRHRTESLG